MDLSVLLSAFSLLFLAEIGDKSQILAMTLAHRHPTVPVVAGTFAAFALLNLLAVWVGLSLFEWVPRDVVLTLAAGLFLYFGYRSWRAAEDSEEGETVKGGISALVTSFTMIFIAELGDKTQLAMVALAASTGEIVSVFVGGTLALWAVSLMGIAFGATLLRKIRVVWVHRVSAVLFGFFGFVALAQVLFGFDIASLA